MVADKIWKVGKLEVADSAQVVVGFVGSDPPPPPEIFFNEKFQVLICI